MLDESLPTFRYQPSQDNPLTTLLYYTFNGSDPKADYLLKRPVPSTSPNQYAIGLLDVSYQSLVYGEVLAKPVLSQPTLSAAEIKAQRERGRSSPPPAALTPDSFTIALYNPDQNIIVKRQTGRFGKSDVFEFDVPENAFAQPTTSRLDQDADAAQPTELVPKVLFRWKKDGVLTKDMTCFMCGRSVGGQKSKEPDITVALYKAGRSKNDDGAVTIYEPNMARVDIEDRKGLEVAFLLSAEAIRDLWLSPRLDVFNTSVAGGASTAPPPVANTQSQPHPRKKSSPPPVMSGALNTGPTPPPPQQQQQQQQQQSAHNQPSSRKDQDAVEAETKRLQAMVKEEERQARAREERAKKERQQRERRDEEEARRIQKEIEREEKERRRKEAEVDKETERLRKQYGVPPPPSGPPPQDGHSPQLPPRPQFTPPMAYQQNQGAGYSQNGLVPPQYPPRPQSAGPSSGRPGLNADYYNGSSGGNTVPMQYGPPYAQYQEHKKKTGGFGEFFKSSGKKEDDKKKKKKTRKNSF